MHITCGIATNHIAYVVTPYHITRIVKPWHSGCLVISYHTACVYTSQDIAFTITLDRVTHLNNRGHQIWANQPLFGLRGRQEVSSPVYFIFNFLAFD